MTSSTAQMLAQIECGTALQAINAVRYHTAPPGPLFVSQLDEVLAPYRSSTHGSTLQRGDFIEVVGASGSGKSTFLSFLLLTSLLPYSLPLPLPSSSTPHHIPLGGKSQFCALLHSVSSPSSIPALARVMRGHIRTAVSGVVSTVGPARLTPAMERAIEACVAESLGRLRIVKVKGRYRYWALALRSLAYPLVTPGAGGGEEALSLVCMDGLSACFWPERYAEEERSAAGKKRTGVPGVRGLEGVGMRDVMDAIGVLRKEMGCVVVTTTQGLWHEKKPETSQPTQFFAPYLPPPYPSPWAFRPGDASEDPSTSTQAYPSTLPASSTSTVRPQPESAHWPFTFQLVLLGRSRGLQMPTDVMLADALNARDRVRRGGVGDRYMARVRMRGVEGRLGGRAGVEWGFGIGDEGLEVFAD